MWVEGLERKASYSISWTSQACLRSNVSTAPGAGSWRIEGFRLSAAFAERLEMGVSLTRLSSAFAACWKVVADDFMLLHTSKSRALGPPGLCQQ